MKSTIVWIMCLALFSVTFAMPNPNPQTEPPKNFEKPKDSTPSGISSSRPQRMTVIPSNTILVNDLALTPPVFARNTALFPDSALALDPVIPIWTAAW